MPDLNLGTLVGYIRLDDSGVDDGVRGATSKIKGFGTTGAKEGEKAGQQIGDAAGKGTVDSFGKAEGPLGRKTRSIFGSVGRAAAGILGGIGVAQILTKGWDRLTGIENARAMLQGLGHDTATVERIMDDALASVKGTAFGLDEAATAAANAVAAGIKPGRDLEGVLRLVADAAAITNAPLGEMGEIFNAVAASGKLNTENMLRLQRRGLPVLVKLAEHYGVANDAAQKMVTDGEVSFADFADVMRDTVGGAALEMGNTTTGVIKNMGAAFSRLGADVLEDLVPTVKLLAQGVTAAVDAWGALPGPIKNAALAMAAIVALQKSGLFTQLATGAGALVTQLKGIRTEGLAASGVLGKLGKGGAVGLLVTSLFSLKAAWDATHRSLSDFNLSIDENTAKLDENSKATVRQNLAQYADLIAKAGISMDELVDAVASGNAAAHGFADELKAMETSGDKLVAIPKALFGTSSEANRAAVEVQQMALRIAEAEDAQKRHNQASEEGIELAEDSAIALGLQNVEIDGQMKVVDELGNVYDSTADAQEAFRDGTMESADTAERARRPFKQVGEDVQKLAADFLESAENAHRAAAGSDMVARALDKLLGRTPGVEEAVRRFDEILLKSAKSLELAEDDTGSFKKAIDLTTGAIDTSTDAGQKLYDWVTESADAARTASLETAAYSGETKTLTEAAKDAADKQAAQRKEFIEAGIQAGLTREQMKDLADAYFDMPSAIKTTVEANPDFSKVDAKIAALKKQIVKVNVQGDMGIRMGRGVTLMADGGWVSGGTPNRDSVPILGMPGEFMLSKAMLQGTQPVPPDVVNAVNQGASANPSVVQNIYPAAGMSEQAVADKTMDRLMFVMGAV